MIRVCGLANRFRFGIAWMLVVAVWAPATADQPPPIPIGEVADRVADWEGELRRRSITQLRQTTSSLLRSHAVEDVNDPERFDAATIRLANWYAMLRHDGRHATSSLVRSSAASVRVRLLRAAKERRRWLGRHGIERGEVTSGRIDAAIERALDPSQQRDRNAANLAGAGPAGLDRGWQLVELIERIVRPDFWQSTGGPGVVHYYASRRVLVVRATSDVHQEIKDLLTALR